MHTLIMHTLTTHTLITHTLITSPLTYSNYLSYTYLNHFTMSYTQALVCTYIYTYNHFKSLTHTPCNHSHLSYTYLSHCVSYTALLLHFSYPNYTYPNHITSHIFQSLSLYLLYTYLNHFMLSCTYPNHKHWYTHTPYIYPNHFMS